MCQSHNGTALICRVPRVDLNLGRGGRICFIWSAQPMNSGDHLLKQLKSPSGARLFCSNQRHLQQRPMVILLILAIYTRTVTSMTVTNILMTRSLLTCESLVSREFSRILLTFHFSISISRHFHFTFHSRSRSQGIFISLFILEMSERKTKFTFQFSKRVKSFQISLFFSRKKSEIVHETLHFVIT